MPVPANTPFILTLNRHVDDRGWFGETFRENRLSEIGVLRRFVQENQSYSKHLGTLRGLHFQVPPAAQAKLVSVLRGRVLDIVVDVRRESPTYGKFVSAELSDQFGQQMYVPVGFAHGFLTLEDNVTVLYKVSEYYAPERENGIRWNDPQVAVPWPISDADITLSDKDRRLPLLREFLSPFEYAGDPLCQLVERRL